MSSGFSGTAQCSCGHGQQVSRTNAHSAAVVVDSGSLELILTHSQACVLSASSSQLAAIYVSFNDKCNTVVKLFSFLKDFRS